MIDVLAAQGIQATQLGIITTNITQIGFKVFSTATGQGTSQPRENIWSDHAVVEYNGNVYDPSYGLEYGEKSEALKEFVRQSVEYVGTYRPATMIEKYTGATFGHHRVLEVTSSVINFNAFQWS
jgi:hypothetical protein